MKTYNYKTFFDEGMKIMKSLHKNKNSPIEELKNKWFLMPEFLKDTTPYIIKNKTLFIHAKNNAIIIQYKELEILKECKKIIADINKIKVIKK